MKLKSIAAVLALSFLTVSCGILGTGNSASGSVNGQSSGAALKTLYGQYKTDGKVDLNNISNIIALAQLANGIQGLNGVDDKSQFYTDFAEGLILGSGNLVTEKTSSPVTGALKSLVGGTDLSSIMSAGVAAAAQSKKAQKAKSQTQETVGNVAGAISELSEKTAGVASTLSSLNSIFGLVK